MEAAKAAGAGGGGRRRGRLCDASLAPVYAGNRPVQEEGWPTDFSNHIHFYQWHQGASMAALMHAEDFHGEFSIVRQFAHCDGLVLAPTDTGIYLFNPVTRETVKLLSSNRHRGGVYCRCDGLGRP